MAVNQRRRRLVLFLSFMLLPVTLNYFSPYLIIDGLFKGVLSGAFLVWGLFFVTSLLFGRAACSYICPYGGLQMTLDKVAGRPLKQIGWLRKFRYALGILWIALILWPMAAHGFTLRWNPLYLTENGVSADNLQKVLFYYFLVVCLALLPLFLGKRATCHYLCPMSVLNMTGSKLKDRYGWRSLRLVAQPEKCVSCGACSRACSMSLQVTEMVRAGKPEHSECILCGECVSACATGAVERRFCAKRAKP